MAIEDNITITETGPDGTEKEFEITTAKVDDLTILPDCGMGLTGRGLTGTYNYLIIVDGIRDAIASS